MARRRKAHSGHVNHERWVISYADFVTLLFAFFVVMFATANADKGKARAISEAVKAALDQSGSKPVKQAISEALNEGKLEEAKKTYKDQNDLVELRPSLKLLQQQLKTEIDKGQVELHMEPRGLAISFNQAAVFDSGEAVIKDSAVSAVEKVASAILKLPNQIRLEGHTDNLPIHNAHFNDNWSLSSARSIAILHMLNEKFGVPEGRMAVSGYADVAPIASNDTEEGRAKNRRVDVIILSIFASANEPGKPVAFR